MGKENRKVIMASSDSADTDWTDLIKACTREAMATLDYLSLKSENDKALRKLRNKGVIPLPKCNLLIKYRAALAKAIVSEVAVGVAAVKDDECDTLEQLFGSKAVREGLQQMVQISITVIQFFVICEYGIFSKRTEGITKAIQLLMCEFWLECAFIRMATPVLNQSFFFVFLVYFAEFRGKQAVSVLNDVEKLKNVIKSVSNDENESFRFSFPRWFCNPWEPYSLSIFDDRAEFKAFMLVMTFTCLSLDELEPLIHYVIEDEYFGEAIAALAPILFGIAETDVSWMNLF